VGDFAPNLTEVKDLAGLADALDRLRRLAARGTGKSRVSVRDLSRRTGLPHSTVHTYVSGRSLPAIDVLDRIVLALGTPPEVLAAWSDAWFRITADRDGRPALAPRQLPPGVTGFVGRHDQVRALDRLLPVRDATPPGWARPRWRCTGRAGWPAGSRTGSCA
jgi:transcriptional regulator with XRE-family HTH domain